MTRLVLLLAASIVAGCQTSIPTADPRKAWVELATPFPNDRLLMAERLDKQRLAEGRFFEVTPGNHELIVRFDYDVSGGGSGLSIMAGSSTRTCFLTIHYAHFEAGHRYVLEGRSMALTPEARLYNAKREIVAEVSESYCLM